jgi:hypothetical protein
MKRRCPKCSAEWEIKGPVAFREECPECAAYVHTCANCRIYDPGSRNCRSPTAEPTADPSAVNFCEEFEFGVPEAGPANGPVVARPPAARPPARPLLGDEARKRFEDLFRKPPT